METLGESLIPERYTRFDSSALEVAVLAGGNKPFRFELRSEENGTEKAATDGDSANDSAAKAGNPADAPKTIEATGNKASEGVPQVDRPPKG
jgi:hypothetical protein